MPPHQSCHDLLRLSASGIGLLAAQAAMSVCGARAAPAELVEGAGAGMPRRGGVLRLVRAGGAAETLDPTVGGSPADLARIGVVFDELFVLRDGTPFAELAESVEVAPDARSFVLRVGDGVYWHDGTPLGAADVAHTRRLIERAATAANVHEFVERLRCGYDTRVGEVGGSLSGGELQRISIVRAILKDAPIDDPTAALDAQSETAVQRVVDALVVDGGVITERGRHTDLLATGGRSAAMWRAPDRARSWTVSAR
jgi:ABC-type transport system substrate-binding protein